MTRLCLLCMTALVVAGCGVKWPEFATIEGDPLSFLSDEDKALTPPPPDVTAIQMKETDLLQRTPPMALKNGGHLGSLGLNLETYLSEPLPDRDMRLKRLERALVAMHKDMVVMGPAVQRLASARPDMAIQPQVSVYAPLPSTAGAAKIPEKIEEESGPALVPATDAPVSLSALNMMHSDVVKGDEQAPARSVLLPEPVLEPVAAPDLASSAEVPVLAAPVELAQQGVKIESDLPVAPPLSAQHKPVSRGADLAERVYKAASPSKGDGPMITGVRVGHHADKVRMVFDVSKKGARYSVDLDNSENLLVIEVRNVGWGLPYMSQTFPKRSALLKSYSVSEAQGGSGRVFVVELKRPSALLKKQVIAALSGAGERIVIDLKL